jgi:hypothetical protein
VEALRQADSHRFDAGRIRAHAEKFSTERFEREFGELLETRMSPQHRATATRSAIG